MENSFFFKKSFLLYDPRIFLNISLYSKELSTLSLVYSNQHLKSGLVWFYDTLTIVGY